MLRLVLAATLLGLVTGGAPAAPPALPKETVFEGVIADVWGVYGLLNLTVGSGAKAKDRQFDIGEARIVGLEGDEWKVGDLRKGDRVRVVLAGDGRTVQEVRVLPPHRRRR
jgi:hypothetical protein